MAPAFYSAKNFDPLKRKRILLNAGITAILLFVILRFTNLYGDPRVWSVQKNALFTLMSFVNTTKYPVSLLYTLMTLGPVLIIMAWMENWKTNLLEPARIVGRVPLFYYILHFYLIHFTVTLRFHDNNRNVLVRGQLPLSYNFRRNSGRRRLCVGLGLCSMDIHCYCVVSPL